VPYISILQEKLNQTGKCALSQPKNAIYRIGSCSYSRRYSLILILSLPRFVLLHYIFGANFLKKFQRMGFEALCWLFCDRPCSCLSSWDLCPARYCSEGRALLLPPLNFQLADICRMDTADGSFRPGMKDSLHFTDFLCVQPEYSWQAVCRQPIPFDFGLL
jgi:hypothetical protein